MNQPTDRNYFEENPIHPGILIDEQFVKPSGFSRVEISRQANVSQSTTTRFLNGQAELSENFAIELGLIFNVSPTLLLGLQTRYKLSLAMQERNKIKNDPPLERKSAV